MTVEMWLVITGTILIVVATIAFMMWWKRQYYPSPPIGPRYNPRCAACGWDTDVFLRNFDLRWDELTCRLIVTCPICCFKWSRGCVDEERVTLLLNERVEEKEAL